MPLPPFTRPSLTHTYNLPTHKHKHHKHTNTNHKRHTHTQRVQPPRPRRQPARSASPRRTMKKTATLSLKTTKPPSLSTPPPPLLPRRGPLTTATQGRARAKPRPAVAAAARRSLASAGELGVGVAEGEVAVGDVVGVEATMRHPRVCRHRVRRLCTRWRRAMARYVFVVAEVLPSSCF